MLVARHPKAAPGWAELHDDDGFLTMCPVDVADRLVAQSRVPAEAVEHVAQRVGREAANSVRMAAGLPAEMHPDPSPVAGSRPGISPQSALMGIRARAVDELSRTSGSTYFVEALRRIRELAEEGLAACR